MLFLENCLQTVMFQDETHEPVSVESSIQVVSSLSDNESQTKACKYETREAQAGAVSHAETQTDSPVPRIQPHVQYDEGRLADFLKRICPKVLGELDKVQKSRAFDRYYSSRVEEDKIPRKLHSLNPSSGLPIECRLNCLTWSCTGAVLALGYGSVNHESWCDHRSKINLFNINRPNFSTTTPNQTLETKSCVSCLRGHVNESSTLAAGLVNGEVLVWNLQWEDDCLFGSSETSGGGHEDAVVQIYWITDPSSDLGSSKSILVSASRDGQLIFWHLTSKTGGLRRGQGFGIPYSHLPQLEKGRGLNLSPDELLPITCFSFMTNNSSNFVVAVENGGLFRCSTITTKPISGIDPEVNLSDPSSGSFQSHNGQIRDVQFSPDQHQMFISCSSDGEIRLYNYEQSSPLRTILHDEGIVNGLSWSPSNSGIFLCWGIDATVYFYDLNPTSLSPAFCLKNSTENLKVNFALHSPQ
ncbi:hypothetical protein J437_LFUL008603, partial [Ladona fulva]